MSWFNYYGAVIFIALMIPNIIDSIKNKDAFVNRFDNKGLVFAEQIGRYGSIAFLIFNIPFTFTGWFFSGAELVYLLADGILLAAYWLIWLIMRKKSGVTKAILLSVIPSVIFLFSGIMAGSIPLTLFSLLFAACHITISVKNADFADKSPKKKRNAVICAVSLVLAISLLGGVSYGATIVKSIIPFIEAADMSAEQMIEYDVRNSDTKISVAVIGNGGITYSVYGADGAENAVYDYEIGSLSKTFSGLLFSKLISEGTVSPDDSISEYLDLEAGRYYPTIGRLLTHTSGYAAYYFEPSMIANKLSQVTTNDYYGISGADILDRINATELEDRDYGFCYSNFGIAVLGLVLESIYGRSYTELMNDFIVNELGLDNTAVAKQSGNLDGYWKWQADDGYIPAGGIISDIYAMAEYLQLCMTADGYIANSFRSIKTVDANNPTYVQYGIRIDSVGMTWMLDDENGYIWHNGATSGFNSYLAFDRESGIGVVLLGNFGSAERITLTVIGAKLMSELTEDR